MILWIDAQLSPALAPWIQEQFEIETYPVRSLGLRNATDKDIFQSAREEGAVVMTKDRDFVQLLDRYGTPPQIIWITCGNTSNTRMRHVLKQYLPEALRLLQSGEALVEISDIGS